MIVYADRKRVTCPAEMLARLTGSRSPDDALSDLLEWGELESGVADALCPESDAPHAVVDQLREAATCAARRMLYGGGQPPAIDTTALPPQITVSTPEGYAYYGLHPHAYMRAAERIYQELRPGAAVVIGIRSIGTSLSAVVAATLENAGCEVRSATVRPRGHPFDRHLTIGEGLAERWRARGDALLVIVDEGPGISGSSFAAVAKCLSEVGISSHRIVFLPAWDPDPSTLRSPEAAAVWARHRRYVGAPEDGPAGRDLSGGLWRDLFYPVDGARPPVQPQHERRKYLCADRLWKFAGLGKYGRKPFERARELASAGFVPDSLAFEDGYLVSRFVKGRPLSPSDLNSDLVSGVRRYLTFRAGQFRSCRRPPLEGIKQMVRVNVEEGLGAVWRDRALERLASVEAEIADRATIEIDGRMLPHEWIECSVGYLKTDAVDHCDDHFFPGCQDVLWDVAGVAVEFQPSASVVQALLSDHQATFLQLEYYLIAYLSYRIGYCAMAMDSPACSAADQAGFAGALKEYRSLLSWRLVHE